MDPDTLAATLNQHGFDTSTFKPIAYGGDSPLISLTIPFADRATSWLRLRTLVDQTACWPVIVNDIAAITDYEHHSWAGTPPQILSQALAFDHEAWLIGRSHLTHYPDAHWIVAQVLAALEREYDYLGDNFLAYEDMRVAAESALTSDALWTENDTPLTIDEQLGLADTSVANYWKSTSLEVVLFPTRDCWEIPALIRYYPADPGPDPVTHVSLLRRWSARYGAELISLGRDGLSLRVTRPPQDRADAITLAWEHTIYCQDLYILESVQRALDIYRGAAWGFWWD